MAAGTRSRTIAIIIVAMLFAAGAGYWAYSSHKQRQADKAVVALLSETGARMRDALGIQTAPPTVDRTRFLKKLEEHAATVDRNYQRLKRIDARPGAVLADAADDYLLTSREITKRLVEVRRYRLLFAESARVMRAHMQSDDRTGAWVQQAVKTKERVNREYRGYTLSAGALAKLFESFPASQQKVARYLAPGMLIPDGTAAEAGRRLGEESREMAAEFEKLQQFAAPR